MRTGIGASHETRVANEALELLGNLYSAAEDQARFELAANAVIEYLGISRSLQLKPGRAQRHVGTDSRGSRPRSNLTDDRDFRTKGTNLTTGLSEYLDSQMQSASCTASSTCNPLMTVTAGLMLSHLEQACTIAQSFANRRRLTASLENALDRIRFGWMVTDESGRVRYLSGKSARRFALCGITAAAGEKLTFSKSKDKRKYDATLKVMGAKGPAHRPARHVVNLQSGSAARPALVMFNQIDMARTWSLLYTEPGSIIHYLVDTDNLMLSPKFEPMGGASLTATEHRVLCLLGEGLSISDVAARFSRSELTIRDHVKSIRAKTGSSRQSRLIARLYRNPTWLLSDTKEED